MRILHLLDMTEGGGDGALACAAAVGRAPGDHCVWRIGSDALPPGGPATARAIGVPLGRPMLAWPALRRALRGASFDICVCWSEGVLGAARLAGARRVMGVFTRGPRFLAGLAAARRRRDVDGPPIVCFGAEDAASWRAAGATDVRTAPPVLPLDVGRFATREAIRSTLGISAGERAIALLADPPGCGDARRFAYLAGLLSVGGAPCVAIIERRQDQSRRAARFVRECGRLWRLVAWEGPIIGALPGCDACVSDARLEKGHPLLGAGSGPQELAAGSLSACFAAQLGTRVVLPGMSATGPIVQAGVPVHVAADSTCLSLAAALFPVMDGCGAPSASYRPDGADALRVLGEAWMEMTNESRAGFPLAADMAAPRGAPGAARGMVHA